MSEAATGGLGTLSSGSGMAALTPKELVDAGMAFTLLFLILHFFLPGVRWMAILAIGALLVTMTVPGLLRPFAWLWFRFSHLLGSVMSRLILSLVWLIVLVPMGLMVGLVRGDVLGLKAFRSKPGSLFIERRHTYVSSDLSNPF